MQEFLETLHKYAKSAGKDEFAMWHFTHPANIDLIRKHGLLSWAKAESQGIKFESSGNIWYAGAKQQSLHHYVYLTFIDDSPVHYRMQQKNRPLKWLKIDSSVILGDGVRFCNTVSNKDGAEDPFTIDQAMQKINLNLLFSQHPSKSRADARKAEILVPNHIPREKILNI